jgi:transcription antitermination factor NusG
MAVSTNWYAIYTKPRWEKKVARLLLERGYEGYCPLTRIKKKWSDRIKLVEEPLFKSYVFVHVSPNAVNEIRNIPGVLNFVYWNGKPAVIVDEEIVAIRRFLNDYEEVMVLPIDVKENDKVLITKGVMMNMEAKVHRVLNNKVKVIIESLGYILIANLDRASLKPIYDQKQ